MSDNDAFNEIVDGVQLDTNVDIDGLVLGATNPATPIDAITAMIGMKNRYTAPNEIEFLCARGEYERATTWLRDVVFAPPEGYEGQRFVPKFFDGQLAFEGNISAVPIVINEREFVKAGYVYLRINGVYQTMTRMQ